MIKPESPLPKSGIRTWGLVLSGGGASGIANGGILEVLDQEGLIPDFITGSSMGAIIGALYAYGIPPDRIHDLIDWDMKDLVTLSEKPFHDGLHGGLLRQQIQKHLGPILGDARLRDCKIPFSCIAGRVKKPIRWHRIILAGFLRHVRMRVEKYVFPPDTRIIDAITASSAVPVIFSPVEINGDTFVDLVAFGAIPARTMRELYKPDVVIGTDTQPRPAEAANALPPGGREFLQAGLVSLDESIAACDLVIHPDLPYGMHRFDKAETFWQAGRVAAKEKLSDLREKLIG